MNTSEEIHEFGSCPLRAQPDYGEKTAGSKRTFNARVDYFLNALSKFQYGCVYNDGSCETSMAVIDENDGREIWIQSPKEFWNRRIGMCHDASVFIDAMLSKEGIGHRCCYIWSDVPPRYPTHSFIIAECVDGFKRIIDVFSTEKCFYDEKFLSYGKAMAWRLERWEQYDNGGKKAFMLWGDRMPKPKCGFIEFSDAVIDSFVEAK